MLHICDLLPEFHFWNFFSASFFMFCVLGWFFLTKLCSLAFWYWHNYSFLSHVLVWNCFGVEPNAPLISIYLFILNCKELLINLYLSFSLLLLWSVRSLPFPECCLVFGFIICIMVILHLCLCLLALCPFFSCQFCCFGVDRSFWPCFVSLAYFVLLVHYCGY
jgi:hypothetical protein